jgi:hypothetical protein
MGAAKVLFATQDRSAVIQGMSGIYAGIVVRSKKGTVKKPRLVTSEQMFIDLYGTPDLRYPETQSAIQLLKATDKLWVVRASEEDVKYAGVLVRGGDFNIGDLYNDDVKRIVEPLKEEGLTQEDVETYGFIQVEDKIQIEKLLDKAGSPVINSYEFVLDGTPKQIKSGNKIVINAKDNYAPITDYSVENESFSIVDVIGVNKGAAPFQRIVFDVDADGNQTLLTATKGTTVKNKSNGSTTVVLLDAVEQGYIIVESADEFHDADEIVVLDSNGDETDDSAIQKFKDTIDLYFVTTKQPVTIASTDSIYALTKVSIWQQLFTMLVTGVNPGEWNNNLSVGIEASKDYPDGKAFYFVIYESGLEVERWLVSRDREYVDGFGKKLFVETVVNGNSNYVQVKDNIFATLIKDNSPINPKPTDYSIWRRNQEMIFDVVKDSDSADIYIKEDLYTSDIEVFVNNLGDLNIGDKIKFAPFYESREEIYGTDLYEIYTIENINTDNNQLFLDRQIIRDYSYNDAEDIGWKVFKFMKDLTDIDKHIIDGIQNFPYTNLSFPFVADRIGDSIKIGDYQGYILDGGVNYMTFGENGSAISLASMIFALRTLGNNNDTPVQLLDDGGYTIPAYAQEMLSIANAQGENNTHCYWSMDPSAEESADALTAVRDYADKLMINTHLGSLFTGWVKQYDPYNREYVWTSPSTYGVVTQNFVHRNYTLFTPAAGLTKGKVLGLEVKHQFSDGELDMVVDSRINPIVYQSGQGLIIWGNRTMYAKPSPLQLRSVAFLLMTIRYGLESYLKYELFNYNNPATWSRISSTINTFMSNEIYAKQGVYDFSCIVAPTDFDIDNRKLPIFLGIQPTMDINEIKVTLGVFNKSLAITA